jgi:hypothetical protein
MYIFSEKFEKCKTKLPTIEHCHGVNVVGVIKGSTDSPGVVPESHQSCFYADQGGYIC